MLPPFLAHMAVSGGFALAGVSVRDQRARWGSCSRQRLQKHPAQTTQWPGGHRTKVLHQISARIRNLFSAQLPLGMSKAALDPQMLEKRREDHKTEEVCAMARC